MRYFRLLVLALAVSLVGCKAKKKTVHKGRSGHQAEKVTRSSKNADPLVVNNGLPNDQGNFVRFEVASPEEYIRTFAEVAQLEMKAYGIPASITLAQGLLESGYGRGELALKTNNHFGIKCHTEWDGEYEYHDDDEKGECFRKYNHPMYSFRDHSLFLATRARYKFLFDLSPTDYKRWARGLKQAGYATDRHYPQKLIGLIERYDLHRYDTAEVDLPRPLPAEAEQPKPEVYVVQKGDTLYSISKRYYVSIDELKRMNQINSDHISIGQRLKVRP